MSLDKKSRLAEKTEERKKAIREATRSLDPRFPYRVIAFDFALFTVRPIKAKPL